MTTSQKIHERNLKLYKKQQTLKNKVKTIAYIMAASISLLGVYTKVSYDFIDNMRVEASQGLISPVPAPTPIPVVVYQTKEVLVSMDAPKTEKAQILAYLVSKFGDHAADAITMIRKCENSKFDTNAVNWNRNGTWDAGIMMINQVHGYSMEDMKDWKKNIDAGYKIYKQDNNSFYAWSCAGTINQASYKDNL